MSRTKQVRKLELSQASEKEKAKALEKKKKKLASEMARTAREAQFGRWETHRGVYAKLEPKPLR